VPFGPLMPGPRAKSLAFSRRNHEVAVALVRPPAALMRTTGYEHKPMVWPLANLNSQNIPEQAPLHFGADPTVQLRPRCCPPKKLHLIPLPGVLIDGRPLLHNREKKLTSTIATLKR